MKSPFYRQRLVRYTVIMLRLKTWMQNCWRLVVRLLSDPSVYWELTTRSGWQVMGLFIGVVGLVGGLSGWHAVQIWGATLLALPQQVSEEWIAQYPPQLVMHWEADTLTLEPTPSQPVVVGWPTAAADLTDWEGPLAIYNPQSNTNPTDLTKNLPQHPLFVIDQKQLWVSDPNNQYSQPMALNEVPLLSSSPIQTWDKTAFANSLTKWATEAPSKIHTGLSVWPILSIGLHLLGRTWFVLMEGTVIWAVSRLMGWRLDWKKLIKFIFIVVPTADLIGLVGQFIYPNLTWSLFPLAFWILVVYLSLQSRKEMLESK